MTVCECQGHSTKSQEWETPAKNLQSSVVILSSEIALFSDLLEFVGSCRVLEFVRSCWELLGLVGSLLGLVRSCQDLSGVVGTCREFVGTCQDLSGVCWDLSGLVRTCREESGVWILWNLTLRESQLWSIKFRPNSLFPRFCGVSQSISLMSCIERQLKLGVR